MLPFNGAICISEPFFNLTLYTTIRKPRRLYIHIAHAFFIKIVHSREQ